MKRDTLIQFYKKHESARADTLSAQARARVKTRVLQNLDKTPMVHAERVARTWTFVYTRFALVAVCILVLLTGTAYASSSAIPGDVLYPVKRAVEDTRVKLASSSETKAKLQVQFTEERLQELEKVEQQSPLKRTTTLRTNPDTQPAVTPAVPPTVNIEPEPEHEDTPAENSAREEISKALESLEKTREDLHKQGKERVAIDLAETIHALNGRANKKRTHTEHSPADVEDESSSHKSDKPKDSPPTQAEQESNHQDFSKHRQRRD